jgi:hypothetical protein
MRTRKPKGPPRQKSLSARKDSHDEFIREAIEDLWRDRLILDSGRRRWSERTGRHEIVWVAAKPAGKLH